MYVSKPSLVHAGQRDISSPIPRHYLLTQNPQVDRLDTHRYDFLISHKFDVRPLETRLPGIFVGILRPTHDAVPPPTAATEIESVRRRRRGALRGVIAVARCLRRDVYLGNRSRPNMSMA